MLRSLFTAVSGIRNHQHKLDVLGNNIANVNTIGFKGSRLTFSDTFNRTLTANGVSGDQITNGKQVGTGVGSSQIQTLFSQGMLQATGNTTDLAIKGKSFFVLKDNDNNLYTRDGSFYFNANRNLVNSSGMFVQGWTADSNGEIQDGSEIANIQLDTNMISNPQSTQNIRITGNLSTTDDSVKSTWTLDSALTYQDASGEIFEVNSSNWDTIEVGQIVQFSNLQTANPNEYVFNFEDSILPNDLSMANEQITVDGTIKVSELINVMNTEFANVDVNVTLENGKIQFQNQNSGISLFEMKLSNFDNTFSMSFEEIEGRESSPVTASAVIYDSQGEAHNLNFIFTPTDTNFINWSWKVELNDPNSDISFQSGNEGIVQFNSDGSMNFEYGQNESNMILNDGDTELAINIDADGHNGISGLTSFGSISTLSVFELDGRPTGTFENMFIEDSGQVIAQFTNGDTRSIAQLVLASFNNPEGLEKGGQNTFIETAASGGVTINSASNLNSSIISGALEMSNVDLAKEFTDMIISQRGFQASTKVITATDQILQDAINLKR